MSTKKTLPPFRSLLKSREVEDPVNIWVHRPLAYAFVWSVFRTPLTPNGVTFIAMAVGLAAGAMFIWGTSGAMLAGGILLWASAILDGADGFLARAKNMQSQFGRALDGAADTFVAVVTVLPGFAHIYIKEHDPVHLALMVPAIGLTLVHLYLYDFYKESFLRATRLDRGGEGEDLAIVERTLVHQLDDKPWYIRFAVNHILMPFLRGQHWAVRMTNGVMARRHEMKLARTEETARIYRTHNLGPMRVWMLISLCPHSYLMAICAMADRLDVYLWVRLVAMNVLFFIAAVWQRRATQRTLAELNEIGAVTMPVAQSA